MEAAQIRHLQLPSRIPQEMWVFESTPFSTNATQAPNAPEEVLQSYDGHTGSASFQRRVFPADLPASRGDVERVAFCLDAMLNREVPDIAVLQDSESFFTLPARVDAPRTRAETLLAGSPGRSSLREGNLDVAAGSSAVVDVQDPYVAAARALLQVSDVGLTEVVRHVGTTSVVAASLLDNLRAVLTDVASNCIDYVTVAKRHVLDQRAQSEEMLSQLLALQERLTAACAERDDLQQQLDEADDECARLREEASRRDDAEERAALLSVLEETAQQRTSALEELHASITGTITGAKTIKDNPISNLGGGGNSPSMSGPPSPQAGDSVPPSRAVSPTRKNSRARGTAARRSEGCVRAACPRAASPTTSSWTLRFMRPSCRSCRPSTPPSRPPTRPAGRSTPACT
jgi:hypothetical protein